MVSPPHRETGEWDHDVLDVQKVVVGVVSLHNRLSSGVS